MRRTGICLVLLNAAAGFAQPHFDAASVKPGGTGFHMQGGPGTGDPGRIVFAKMRLQFLLMKAWDMQIDQVAGPSWIADGDNFYTVTATMPAETSKADFEAMLQRLLIERFQLKFHHETRSFPGYELVVANGGARIRETAQNPQEATGQSDDRPGPLGADGFPALPPGSRQVVVSGRGRERVKFQARSIPQVAAQLGALLNDARGIEMGAPQPRVQDKTGLSGRYDFTLEFDCRGCQGFPAAARASLGLDPVPFAGFDTGPGSGLPTLFRALEQQAGLKLVKVNDVPVDVLVIDHAEKVPLEN